MAIKRATALAALTTLLLGGVTGSASAETLAIYWNAGHAYPQYQAVIDKFQADHPGWTVQWEKYQWPDLRTKLVADFSVGNPPDLVEEPGGWVQEFGLAGLLTPLNDFIAKDGMAMGYPDDWQDYTVKRNMVGDQYFGVQVHSTCATLVYNVDALKAAGFDAPPKTWDEFKKIAAATTSAGKFGFAPNPDTGYYWPWIFQAGGDYYDPQTNKVLFNSPEAAQAVQFVSDLIHKDKSAPVPVTGADYEGPQKLFTAGRAAMILTGPWDVTPIRKGNPNLHWDVAPSLTGKVQGTIAAGTSMFIPKAAKHPAEAWELLKAFTALDTELQASVANGMTMPRKSWAADAGVKADPTLGKFSQCLTYAHDTDAQLRLTGKSAKIDAMFKSAMDEVMYNDAPVQDTLDKYAKQANDLLASK
jgi:multiple sugar transport system substrate-binding protein